MGLSDTLPPPERTAFLLDFDGTLVDIAARPELVVVPGELPGALQRLRAICGDALAIVTGRPLDFIDERLPSLPWAVAAEHGTAIRHAPDEPVTRAARPAPPREWLARARHLAEQHEGALLEPKQGGFALHYRGAPDAGETMRLALEAMLAEQPDATFALIAAKMAWEVRPRGIDKGVAVETLMRQAPFAGRLPVFVGDDVTDQDGIEAARRLGGVGLFVPEDFGEPADVRAWLLRLSHTEPGSATWAVG